MRVHVPLAVFGLITMIAVPTCAATPDQQAQEQQAIAALEAKISQAQPREQCFLYAKLIHEMTEYSVQHYAAGDVQNANSLLQRIQQLAGKLRFIVSGRDKRLKNAEILLSHTSFRLKELLHASDYQDRPLVEQTLAQVDKAENDAMLQVFGK
jgi:hypothetical protein